MSWLKQVCTCCEKDYTHAEERETTGLQYRKILFQTDFTASGYSLREKNSSEQLPSLKAYEIGEQHCTLLLV